MAVETDQATQHQGLDLVLDTALAAPWERFADQDLEGVEEPRWGVFFCELYTKVAKTLNQRDLGGIT